MANVKMLTIFLLMIFSTVTDAAKKRNKDKIIIHVPHKIHKHHHTHTKYKVIPLPAQKGNTVIYLKERIQPVIKEVPTIHAQLEIAKPEPKVTYRAPEVISPPHQISAQSFLQSLFDHELQNPSNSEHEEYGRSPKDQKTLETSSDQKSEENLAHNPVILLSLDNLIKDLSLKPAGNQPHKPPKYVPYKSYPSKHHHFVHSPRSSLVRSHKVPLQDSVAYTTSQVHKTVIPRPKASSYRVKEENHEREAIHFGNQYKLNTVHVPLKLTLKGKSHTSRSNHHVKNLNSIPSDDYEYEHVGYLVVDENSRNHGGKNLRNELSLTT